MSETNNIKDTIDAVTGLVKAVPIYEDALQPAAKEVGKSLLLVTKTINIALVPISTMVWGFDKIKEYIDDKLADKLINIKESNITTPDISIVGPAFEALRYAGNNEKISNLYANLIANSMDKDTLKKSHPAFVEIIRNMCSDEALILQTFTLGVGKGIMDIKLKNVGGGEFNLINNYSHIGLEAGCAHIDLTPKYIDNLCRLGILSIPAGRFLISPISYDHLLKADEYLNLKKKYEVGIRSVVEIKKYIELTELGSQFKEACVEDKK